ncbi:hypothetical protein BRADI_3g36476v3 [Brachypodium distachyon]|uniref:Uncharacterized protein n=1 Tax=Brachypodium distachyon TaxID=15368 RepID=A0A2K2D1I8_BRADI|nr:hypothetical protein BRADI_3g36476v3 [Brachypodium distachyon]
MYGMENAKSAQLSTWVDMIKDMNGTADDNFFRAWLITAISGFFRPSTSTKVSPQSFPAVLDLTKLSDLGFCQFVVDSIQHAFLDLGDKKNSMSCCVFHLLMLYLDSLAHGEHITGCRMRVQAWTPALIKKVMKKYTKEDGQFGKLPLKDVYAGATQVEETNVLYGGPAAAGKFVASKLPTNTSANKKRKIADLVNSFCTDISKHISMKMSAFVQGIAKIYEESDGASSSNPTRKRPRTEDDESEFEDSEDSVEEDEEGATGDDDDHTGDTSNEHTSSEESGSDGDGAGKGTEEAAPRNDEGNSNGKDDDDEEDEEEDDKEDEDGTGEEGNTSGEDDDDDQSGSGGVAEGEASPKETSRDKSPDDDTTLGGWIENSSWRFQYYRRKMGNSSGSAVDNIMDNNTEINLIDLVNLKPEHHQVPTFELPDILSFEENVRKKAFDEVTASELKKSDENKSEGKDLFPELCQQSMIDYWMNQAASFDEAATDAPQGAAAPGPTAVAAPGGGAPDPALAKRRRAATLADERFAGNQGRVASKSHRVAGNHARVARPSHKVTGKQVGVVSPSHRVAGNQGRVATPSHRVVGNQGGVATPSHRVAGNQEGAASYRHRVAGNQGGGSYHPQPQSCREPGGSCQLQASTCSSSLELSSRRALDELPVGLDDWPAASSIGLGFLNLLQTNCCFSTRYVKTHHTCISIAMRLGTGQGVKSHAQEWLLWLRGVFNRLLNVVRSITSNSGSVFSNSHTVFSNYISVISNCSTVSSDRRPDQGFVLSNANSRRRLSHFLMHSNRDSWGAIGWFNTFPKAII